MKKYLLFVTLLFLVFFVVHFAKAQYPQNNSSIIMQMQQQINYLKQQINSLLGNNPNNLPSLTPTTPTTPTTPYLCCDGSIPWVNSMDHVCQTCPAKCGSGMGMYPNSGTPCINSMTKREGWCGAGSCTSTPSSSSSNNNCCMCAYEEIKECNKTPKVDKSGITKCPKFNSEKKCNSDKSLGCKWQDDGRCYFEPCEASNSVIDGSPGCQLDKEFYPKEIKCTSYFKNDCLNFKQIALNDKACTDFSLIKVETLPATEEIISYLNNKKCNTFKYFQSGHGTMFDCPKLNDVVDVCLSCTGGNCDIGIVSYSCSQFQDKSEVKILANNIKKALCDIKSSATVVITAQQASLSAICSTPETIAVSCENIMTSYQNCSNMPKYCHTEYQTAKCSYYEPSGKYVGDTEFICCSDPNEISIVYKWVLPVIGFDFKKTCPSFTGSPVSMNKKLENYINKEQLLASILDSISSVISQLAEKLGIKLK